ncbi:hypothetical protein [Chthonobacter albigriseus]|uniref:hypothetical protein n=1 Tax=Chthonobacter albigriseus TaxID=1683161 RepID=UPI003140C8D6
MTTASLVQILLPLEDNEGSPIPRGLFDGVERELVARFGGLTAHTRAPAEGVWTEEGAGRVRDRVVVFEVMTADLDPAWWADYRRALESRFSQSEVVIRAMSIQRL